MPDAEEIESWLFTLTDEEKELIKRSDWPELWHRYYYDLVDEISARSINDRWLYFGPSRLGLVLRDELLGVNE